jgi:hypothetical protein
VTRDGAPKGAESAAALNSHTKRTARRRSLVDELCEGDHGQRPAWVQGGLRILANNRFLDIDEQLRRARLFLERAGER